MTLPYDDIVSASGSIDRPVLLSEKTQLIAIKALQIAELRANWNEMSDSEWDALDDMIGEAYTEILSEIEGLPMLVELKHAFKTNTQAITASTEASVLFNSGDHEASPQVNRLKPNAGKVQITGFIHITSGTATQLTVAIRKNGTDDIARQTFANTALAQRMTISAPDECLIDDYYELRVLTNQNATIQNTEYAYLKSIRWYES